MNVWRLNIKTASEYGLDPRKFCLDNGILGVGWQIEAEGEVDWETYYRIGEEEYCNNGDNGWWPAVNALKNRMEINDLCWTRDESGIYYVGRITSDWQYRNEEAFCKADVVNVRSCDWHKVGTIDNVPGKVVNSFIPARTVQVVDDETVLEYSKYFYNSKASDFKYEHTHLDSELFSLLSSEDCEDIVGIYLQEQGYRMIPSSCKSGTSGYEYVLRHCETYETAVAQVKNGYVELCIDDFAPTAANVFLFTTKGGYTGSPAKNVTCLTPEEVSAFVQNKLQLMPPRIQIWVELSKTLRVLPPDKS